MAVTLRAPVSPPCCVRAKASGSSPSASASRWPSVAVAASPSVSLAATGVYEGSPSALRRGARGSAPHEKPAGVSVVLFVGVPCRTSARPSVWRCASRRSAIRAAPSASATVLTPATKTALSPRRAAGERESHRHALCFGDVEVDDPGPRRRRAHRADPTAPHSDPGSGRGRPAPRSGSRRPDRSCPRAGDPTPPTDRAASSCRGAGTEAASKRRRLPNCDEASPDPMFVGRHGDRDPCLPRSGRCSADDLAQRRPRPTTTAAGPTPRSSTRARRQLRPR